MEGNSENVAVCKGAFRISATAQPSESASSLEVAQEVKKVKKDWYETCSETQEHIKAIGEYGKSGRFEEKNSLSKLNGIAQDGLALLSSLQFRLDLLAPQLPTDEEVESTSTVLESWKTQSQSLRSSLRNANLQAKENMRKATQEERELLLGSGGESGDLLWYGDQIVAIKVLHYGNTLEERAALKNHFAREVNMMSRVYHENLVKFIRACKDPLMVIVKDLLLGMSLMTSIRPGLLDCQEAINFGENLLCGPKGMTWVKVHVQDKDSCGVHVLTWLQMWDATVQGEDSYTMPFYSKDNLHEMKVGVLWWLVTHSQNTQAETVLSLVEDIHKRRRTH